MTPQKADRIKLLTATVALALASILFLRFYRSSNPSEGKAYFYDLSGKVLFTASHSSVPPIKGVSGEEEDGVRAIVISTTGDCRDAGSRKIAYLETYAPELKHQVEARLQQGPGSAEQPSGGIRRGEAQAFILVKRPDETEWHPMNTPEAQEILQTINVPGPDGRTPVVCVP